MQPVRPHFCSRRRRGAAAGSVFLWRNHGRGGRIRWWRPHRGPVAARSCCGRGVRQRLEGFGGAPAIGGRWGRADVWSGLGVRRPWELGGGGRW